jgi:hypothetical protein
MAQGGLQQLSRAHTQIAYAGAITSAPSGRAAQATGAANSGAKVSKVLEFYTDW